MLSARKSEKIRPLAKNSGHSNYFPIKAGCNALKNLPHNKKKTVE
jgi:hypothetical protein